MSADPAVRALAAQLAQLRGRVEELEEKNAAFENGESGERAYAPNWLDFTPEERARRMDGLIRWVNEVLAVQYPHVYLRPCWPDHPAAVWELSVLRAEWYRVYNHKYPELSGAQTWHDRWLPGVDSRLRAAILKDCKDRCGLLRTQSPVPARPSRPRAV